jgi:alpha-mannosidase
LYDKTLQQEIFSTDKFLGAEWFTMHSFGNGAGEFADIQQPDMEGFDKMSNHHPGWKVVEDGLVRTVATFAQKVPHMEVEFRLVLYKAVKRLDMEVSLLSWDGTPYREFRLAFPLNMKDGEVTYEVPFGVCRVGKDELKGSAGERYVTPCKNVHPRGIMNWIGAGNERYGVTLSSSVAVADYIDPTSQPLEGPVLQPVLLASRHSCHWEGLQFSQEGDHHYRFSMTSHEPGWEHGYRFGMASNEPLQVIFNPHKEQTMLAENQSFFSVSGGAAIISTVKMCEDDDHVVLRLYDAEGRDANVRLDSYFEFSGTRKTDMIEHESGDLIIGPSGLNISLGHHAIETIKMIK